MNLPVTKKQFPIINIYVFIKIYQINICVFTDLIIQNKSDTVQIHESVNTPANSDYSY